MCQTNPLSRFVVVATGLLALLAPASAGTILERPIPGSGSSSTDAAYDYLAAGDLFYIPDSPLGSWRIDSITTWSVPSTANLAYEFSNISLYGGVWGSPGVTQLATGDLKSTGPTSFTNSNPNIVSTRVWYTGDALNPVSSTFQPGYQDYGDGYPLFQHTFNNLNWVVAGGTYYALSVHGAGKYVDYDTGFGIWFNHVSTLSPDDPTGLSDYTYYFDPDTGALLYQDTNLGYRLNAVMEGSPTPEPASFALLALGLGGLVAFRRKRA